MVELRQYTLVPGARDVLVELFEREFIEPQEEVGMRIGGMYRDRGDPDRFVWFRSFPAIDSRGHSLTAFYDGPVWRTHGAAANATMLDSDDVLLLRATQPPHPPSAPAGPRPPFGTAGPGPECVTVTVWTHLPDDDLTTWLSTEVHEVLERVLDAPVATWRTQPAENNFPRLPVRPDTAFVWLAAFPDGEAAEVAARRLADDTRWRHEIQPQLTTRLTAEQHLDLRPTARSQHPAPAVRCAG